MQLITSHDKKDCDGKTNDYEKGRQYMSLGTEFICLFHNCVGAKLSNTLFPLPLLLRLVLCTKHDTLQKLSTTIFSRWESVGARGS